MPETASRPVLARIVAAHEGRGPGLPDPSPTLQRAMTRAIRRAAMPYEGFRPQVGEVEISRDVDLSAVEDALPEHGLLAAIEDDGGRRGLIALEHRIVDALIEVQTTGVVEDGDLPPRKVTRIDEALSRDFLDLFFGAFAMEIGELKGRDWPRRMAFGSRIADPTRLGLLFPERPFHTLSAQVKIGPGRDGRIVFILPVDPALARQVAQMARAQAKSNARSAHDPAQWKDRIFRALGGARCLWTRSCCDKACHWVRSRRWQKGT